MSVALGTSTLRFNAILHTCASEGTKKEKTIFKKKQKPNYWEKEFPGKKG